MSDKTDQHKNLEKWFREMGYMGPMPESLTTICNSSTSFIWDQLQANTRSTSDVEKIRRNVIINRLKSKPLHKQGDYQHPIKEITLYNKKLALQNKIKLMKADIQEKREKVDALSKTNKIQSITIGRLDSKILKNQEKELLLKKKCEMLEETISEAQETLSTVKRLTPVEPEENPDTSSIKETLQACSKKLEASLKKVPVATNSIKNTTNLPLIRSAKKLQTPRMNLQSYFTLSEKKSVWRSSRKQHGDRENDCNVLNLPKRLFSVAEDENGHPNESKNESLGIVNIDNFDMNSSLIGEAAQEHNINPSIMDAEQTQLVHFPLTDSSLMLRSVLKPSGPMKPAVILYEDAAVKEDLNKLLQNHNRAVIWNVFQGVENDIHNMIMKKLSEGFVRQDSQEKYRDDLAQLHFIHIQTELQHSKNTLALKKLEHKVKQRKEELCNMLSNREFSENRKKQLLARFDAELENIGLDTKLQLLKNEIDSAQEFEEDRQLQMLSIEIEQVKKNITVKMNNIESYIQSMETVLQNKAQIVKKTYSCVEELLPFLEDMSWCDRLTKKLNHEELETFQQFPYGYNRKCSNTNPSTYYRDLCTSSIPEDVKLDSETMYMFAEILETPFTPPEAVLHNIIQTKRKLDVWKSIDDAVKIPQFEHHTLESLEKQESYIQYALDKLHHLLTSPLSQQTLSLPEMTRKCLEIWLEMPFKDLSVSKKLVEGKDYLYYKKKYDSFYNNLE